MRVLITGANRGIGRELANAYRDAGHEVLATARNADGSLSLDVTDPASFQALSDELGDLPIDLLICNAGVFLDRGHTIGNGYSPDLWAQTFAVNVTGVYLTVEALISNVKAANGKIVIISSQMASQTKAPGGSYIYRASKAASLSFGRNLSADLKPEGIAAGIYHPGWVTTDMGGQGADIDVNEAVAGLVQRFDELTLETTGCFRTYSGEDHPY